MLLTKTTSKLLHHYYYRYSFIATLALFISLIHILKSNSSALNVHPLIFTFTLTSGATSCVFVVSTARATISHEHDIPPSPSSLPIRITFFSIASLIRSTFSSYGRAIASTCSCGKSVSKIFCRMSSQNLWQTHSLEFFPERVSI